MSTFRSLSLAIILSGLHSVMLCGQCPDSGTTAWYATAYAIRISGNAYMYTEGSVTGPNAEYSTVTLTQNDNWTELDGGGPLVSLGPPLTDTAGYGQTAETIRSVSINQQGFGIYGTQTHTSGYRSCDGVTVPPFNNGFSGYVTASFSIVQPVVAQAPAAGNTKVPIQLFATYNPNGSSLYSPPSFTISPYAPGVTVNDPNSPPVWTLSGQTGGASLSCTSCQSPTFAANSNAQTGCAPSVTVSYVVDGLQSAPWYVSLVGPVQVSDGAAVHQPAPSGSGYVSSWPWQIVDSCGSPMSYVGASEAFPNGIVIQYAGSNWYGPTPNSWYTGSDGGWIDDIAFYATSGAIPTPLSPQSPLGNVLVFNSLQNITVGSAPGVRVYSATQDHFQDHGGYN